MFRKTINNSDLLLSKSFWWGCKWKPYRNLSEEIRVLRDLEQDAIKKANELTHLRMVGETNIKMDVTVLTHQLTTNSEAAFEFPTEPSILEMRDGIKYEAKGIQSKHGSRNTSNNGGNTNGSSGQQGSKSGSQSGGERSDNKQHGNGNDPHKQSQRKGQAGRSLLEALASITVH
ncbi:MAG: hypothetical protein DRI88_10425 [Bacteroidetes bacterium]|nr:MAG: hypothetical protein DRI88_10425 [Bacteroidota bacterium]